MDRFGGSRRWRARPVEGGARLRKIDNFLTSRLDLLLSFRTKRRAGLCASGGRLWAPGGGFLGGGSRRSRFLRNENEIKPLKTNDPAKCPVSLPE